MGNIIYNSDKPKNEGLQIRKFYSVLRCIKVNIYTDLGDLIEPLETLAVL